MQKQYVTARGAGPHPLLQVLARYGSRLALLAGCAGLATFGILSLTGPRYMSEARLAIMTAAADPAADAETRGAPSANTAPAIDRSVVAAHARAIGAPELLLDVATELRLRETAEFNSPHSDLDVVSRLKRLVGWAPPRTDGTDDDRIVAAMKRRLEITVAARSSTVIVRFQAAEPGLAAEVVNRLIEAYRGRLLERAAKAADVDVAGATVDANSGRLRLAHPQEDGRLEGATDSDEGAAGRVDQRAAVARDSRAAAGRTGRPEARRTARPGAIASLPAQVTVTSPARPSAAPASPRRGPWSLVVSLAVLVLGAVAVVARELVTSDVDRRRIAGPGKAVPPVAEPTANSRVGTHLGEIAARLITSGTSQPGYRTMVAGQTPACDATAEALEIARLIAAADKHVVLVDWGSNGDGIAKALGLRGKPGMAELLTGAAGFEDVIARIPNSAAHFIAGGEVLPADDTAFDPDLINLVLDTLDEVYDHIVVTGTYETLQKLFLAIEGRFDTGVVVQQDSRPPSADAVFLGFEVTDFEIIRYRQRRLTAGVLAGKLPFTRLAASRGEVRA